MAFGQKYEEMLIFIVSTVAPASMDTFRPNYRMNFSKINDPKAPEVFDKVQANLVLNDPVAHKALYDFYLYEKERYCSSGLGVGKISRMTLPGPPICT